MSKAGSSTCNIHSRAVGLVTVLIPIIIVCVLLATLSSSTSSLSIPAAALVPSRSLNLLDSSLSESSKDSFGRSLTMVARPPFIPYREGNLSKTLKGVPPRWGDPARRHNGRASPEAHSDDYVIEVPKRFRGGQHALPSAQPNPHFRQAVEEHRKAQARALARASESDEAMAAIADSQANDLAAYSWDVQREGFEDSLSPVKLASSDTIESFNATPYPKDHPMRYSEWRRRDLDREVYLRERAEEHVTVNSTNDGLRSVAHQEGRPHRYRTDIRIRYGILTIARFVDVRLMPLLNTSLRNLGDGVLVDIFIRKTSVSYAVAEYVRQRIRSFHPYWQSFRVIELYGPSLEKYPHLQRIYYQNAWVNLEILRLWRAELEVDLAGAIHNSELRHARSNWYAIMDDDGYVFLENAKAMLWDIDHYYRRAWRHSRLQKGPSNRTTHPPTSTPNEASRGNIPSSSARRAEVDESIPPVQPDDLLVSTDVDNEIPEDFGYETPALVGGQVFRGVLIGVGKRLFANGGPGYYFTRKALANLSIRLYEYCLANFHSVYGDLIGGACLQEAGAELIALPLSNVGIRDMIKRGWYKRHAGFPVAFHRVHHEDGGMKALHKAYLLSEARKAQDELLHWEDLALNFNTAL